MSFAKTMEAVRVLRAFDATIDSQHTRVLCRALRGHASVVDAVLALRPRETHQTDTLKPL